MLLPGRRSRYPEMMFQLVACTRAEREQENTLGVGLPG